MSNSKNYEELTIRDYFMFGKICSQPEIRKLILDSLLQIDLQEKNGEIEKRIQAYKSTKFTRLDLISEDSDNIVYNAEMQNKSQNPTRQKELPKRSRYYQGLIDTTYLQSGEPYSKLPETYIIFICTFDPFGKGLPIYSFDTKCNEINLPEYDDKAHKIFFNTTADLSGLPITMRNMLEYIDSGMVNDAATEAINQAVIEARLREEWKTEYMLTITYRNEIYQDGVSDGIAQGISQGISQGLVQGQINTLADLVNKGLLSISDAANQANMTQDEFSNVLREGSK